MYVDLIVVEKMTGFGFRFFECQNGFARLLVCYSAGAHERGLEDFLAEVTYAGRYQI